MKSSTGEHVMPDFVIIGAMKCATSTIHDQLAHLPGVSMSEPKEPNFFSDHHLSDEDQWNEGLNWYSSLFSKMPTDDLKGESSTHYTKLPTYPECADRLHEHLPNAKLIYVMRDPIERIVSQFIHEWSMRVIDEGCSIDDAIREYPILVEYSKYAMQLMPYVQRFGIDSILPVFFERVMANPQEELERIAEFIGYQGDKGDVHWVDDDAKNVSSQRQRRNPILNAVLNIPAVQVTRRTLLPESMRVKIRSRWTMKDRPKLSEESVAYLYQQLNPDVSRLGEMLGIELSCESFGNEVAGQSCLEWATGSGEIND